MKRTSIFLAAMLMVLNMTAQGVELEWVSTPKHSVGLYVGGRVNDMSLSYAAYDKYEHSMMIGPSAGLFYRHRIKGLLYLRTDVAYAVRGMDMKWCDVHYDMWVPYLDFRPMLHLSLCRPWWEVVPYVALGVDCSFTLPGKINFESNSVAATSMALNKSNIKPFDFALRAGVGTDIHFEAFERDFFVTVEAGVDFALMNNFSSAELEGEAQAINPEMGNTQNFGTRKNRGVELTVGLGIPLVKKRILPSGKGYMGTGFSLEDYLAQKDSVDEEETEPMDTVAEPETHETVWVKEAPYRRAQDYEYKECYTLEEILNMVARGKEVCDLRICLFDIKFAFDSYELTMGSKQKLNRIVKLLKDYPQYNLHVGGHTDSIGSDAYNDRLSLNRASSVVNYLVDKGIEASRLSYEGFGERYPLESNATERGRYINRRVEFELYCSKRNVELELEDEEEEQEDVEFDKNED